jgi:hypothetical protein
MNIAGERANDGFFLTIVAAAVIASVLILTLA